MSSETVAKEGVTSGPEAEDPALTAGRRLAERLKQVLHPSIKAFEKKTLITFDWAAQGKGKQSTSVVLKEVKARQGAGTFNLTFSWKPTSGKDVDVQASVSVVVTAPRQQRPSVFILLRLDDGSRSLTLARGENILKWDRGDKI
ncbi:MAG TPA: hypothetical protein VLS89_08440, partial [Candidatus Nanopelagicales bacterium]|nr:hypothetical protein [Candidatus Nanopelagicales bacterium]